MADDALKTVKRRAEDNAWFLLATLYGQPTIGIGDLELRLRNRRAWNRYMANAIHPDVLEKLIGERKYSAEELNPSLASEIELAYSERHKQAGSAASTALPIEPWLAIDFSFDFSNLEFDELYLEGFLFPSRITFARASFSGTTNFRNVSFLAPAYFGGATFSDFAAFEHAIFYDYARFSGAIFSKGAYFEHTMFCADTLFDHVAFKQADFGRARDGAVGSRRRWRPAASSACSSAGAPPRCPKPQPADPGGGDRAASSSVRAAGDRSRYGKQSRC